MTQIPDALNFIQEEETAAYAPVSESTLFKVGGSMNYLLNHYPMPAGMIIDFAGPETAIPPGFIVCDGRTFSRTGTTADLFAAIGTYWGVGDGITTTNTPDFRGLFGRMVDRTTRGQAGRDPDHASRSPTGTGTSEDVGSFENQDLLSHLHVIPNLGNGTGAQNGQNFGGGTTINQTTTAFAGGNETRPQNLYILKLIKY